MSLVNEGVPSKFIFTLIYLYNNIPRDCTFLATETTMSDFRFAAKDVWFPNEVCSGFSHILDWFERTIQVTGNGASDSDMNLANDPFGAKLGEVVVTEGHAIHPMLHVPLCLIEQACNGIFYTLSKGRLKRFMERCAATAYSRISGDIGSKDEVGRCMKYVKNSKTLWVSFHNDITESIGAWMKKETDAFFRPFGHSKLALTAPMHACKNSVESEKVCGKLSRMNKQSGMQGTTF